VTTDSFTETYDYALRYAIKELKERLTCSECQNVKKIIAFEYPPLALEGGYG
jgi:hypothetical protein